MSSSRTESPPVLILGGGENSLSIVRSLSRNNIQVRVSAEIHCPALQSRFCAGRYSIPSNTSAESFWGDLLLSGDHPELRGSVLLACGDDAVAFLANHHAPLALSYILDDSIPDIQLAMLDKQKTLEMARLVGCQVPQSWKVDTLRDLEPLFETLVFPIMIKPINTFLSNQMTGKKFFVAQSPTELFERARQALDRGLRIVICEIIPGPDREVQSSYYTYINKQGESLFRFTKRVLRRDPSFGGLSCLHKTQWLPETAEVGERFFRGIGFQGLGCVEFKRDPRDGQLKVIECNARFTAAQELLVRSGLDIAFLIYCQLTGRPLPSAGPSQENFFLWYPIRDIKGQIMGRHGLPAGQWFRSVLHWNTIFPYFKLDDPGPSMGLVLEDLRERLRSRRHPECKPASLS